MKQKILTYLRYYIFIFLFAQPFLDMSVTLLPEIPLSTVIRGLSLVIALIYLILTKHYKFLCCILSIFLCFVLHFYFQDRLGENLDLLFKWIYLPIFGYFFLHLDEFSFSKKHLTIVYLVYINVIILTFLTNTGLDSYRFGDRKGGFSGLFLSVNEISAIIIGLFPIILSYLETLPKKRALIFVIIEVILAALIVGTKILLFGCLFVLLVKLFPFLYRKFSGLSVKKKVASTLITIVILCGSIYAFTFTNVYKNMLIQAKFFHVDEVQELFSYHGINKVIFNDRLDFIQDNYEVYRSASAADKIFGLGNLSDQKLVEIDWFDLWFRFGIVGIASYIAMITYYLKNKKLTKNGYFALILFFAIATTSGHVLFYPAVCIYIALLFFLEAKKETES